MRRVWLIIILLPFLSIQGCSKLAEKAAENAIESEISKDGGSADVDLSDGGVNVTIDGDDGKTFFNVGEKSKIPNDFPKDIPVYQGLVVKLSHAQPDQGAFTIQATSGDDLGKIAAFYEEQAAQGGWDVETNSKQGEAMAIYRFVKADRQLEVVLAEAGDETTVTLNTTRK